MDRETVERLLEVYSFEELLEVSSLDIEDALVILYQGGHLELPEVKPLG